MIKITNGQITLTVPSSAFHQIYKDSGFRILDGEKRTEASAETFPTLDDETPEGQNSDEETEDSEELPEANEFYGEERIDLSEIPLSEMDFYQLSDYADQLGLNHRGIRSKKELRALIRDNL